MPALQNQILPPPLNLTWKQIGRTKLTVPGNSILVANLPKVKWLFILVHCMNVGVIEPRIRFNGDAGANYASRRQVNGAADALAPNATAIISRAGGSSLPYEITAIVLNHGVMEKMVHFTSTDIGAAGAGTTPNVSYTAGKWVNAVDQITSVEVINVGAGTFDVDSDLIVLGKN